MIFSSLRIARQEAGQWRHLRRDVGKTCHASRMHFLIAIHLRTITSARIC